jgi:hypothetical protein
LADDLNVWAIFFDMFLQLVSRHVLILISKTNIATEFGTIKLSMGLEFTKGLPNDLASTIGYEALMWELTEVNAILEDLIHILQEVTASLAVWTADIITWCHLASLLLRS